MGLWEILKGEQPGIFTSLLHYKDVGQYGEYLTEYALLSKSMEGEHVVLKNLYLRARITAAGYSVARTS